MTGRGDAYRRASAEDRAWKAGAQEEARLRDDWMTSDQRQVRDVWEGMCRLRNPASDEIPDNVAALASIFWAGLPLRRRLRLARKAVAGR